MGNFSYLNKKRNRELFGDDFFEPPEKKTEIEKYLNSRKEAYPLAWRYFVNRLSWGINRLSDDYRAGTVELTDKQLADLHNLVLSYYSRENKKLVIPGSKDMDFFKKMTELVPDLSLFKLIYGKKGSWASRNLICKPKRPVPGGHYLNGDVVERFNVPLLLNYNVASSATSEFATLFNPNNIKPIEPLKYRKAYVELAEPTNESKKWLYANTYVAWLPVLSKRETYLAKYKKDQKMHEINVRQYKSLRWLFD